MNEIKGWSFDPFLMTNEPPDVGPPSLDGPWAKVRWGELHLENIEKPIVAFREANPIRIVRNLDTERSRYVFRAYGGGAPLPLAWGLIIGDCVHNVRSALDHLIIQLAKLGLNRVLTADEIRSTQFPVSATPDKFKDQRRRVDMLDPACRDRIELLQPYDAWDDQVWGPFRLPGPPAPIPNA